MVSPKFYVRTEYPDERSVVIDWPEHVRTPMWGEVWDDECGDVWMIDEVAWDYGHSPLGTQITCILYLDTPEEFEEEDDD